MEIINLNGSQTKVSMTPEQRRKAVQAAYWRTCSPSEWSWSPEEQAIMACYVLWAHQRLSAIAQCIDGELKHDSRESDLATILAEPEVLLSIPQPYRMRLSELLHGSDGP